MVVQPSSHIWILWKELSRGWGNFYGDWSVLRTSQTKVIRGPHASFMLPEPLWRTEHTLLVQSSVWSCEPSGPHPSPQRRVTCGRRGSWQWALNWWLMFNFAKAQRTTPCASLGDPSVVTVTATRLVWRSFSTTWTCYDSFNSIRDCLASHNLVSKQFYSHVLTDLSVWSLK